jgi:hypothetical protein
MNRFPEQTAVENRDGSPQKKRYERPRILSREVIEAMAATCAPSPPAKGNPGLCPSGPISS